MRYTLIIILTLFFSFFHSGRSKADEIDFIEKIVSGSLFNEQKIPEDEAQNFSKCFGWYLRPRLTSEQLTIIRTIQIEWDQGSLSNENIEKLKASGVTTLGKKAQNYCIELFYPRLP